MIRIERAKIERVKKFLDNLNTVQKSLLLLIIVTVFSRGGILEAIGVGGRDVVNVGAGIVTAAIVGMYLFKGKKRLTHQFIRSRRGRMKA